MKKSFLFIPLLGLVFLFGCGTKPTVPVTQTTTTPTVADCKSDMNCLQKNLLACTPTTFVLPFTADSSFNVEVIGEIGKTCDYKLTIIDTKQNKNTGMECKLPMDLMNADRVGHLFGAEKIPGKETTAQTQQELDAQYCTQF